MPVKITKEELSNYKALIKAEKDLLNKFFISNENIDKVFYNENMVIIQFISGYSISSDYLNGLSDMIDYSSYSINCATVTKSFFKVKYDENVLQLIILL